MSLLHIFMTLFLLLLNSNNISSLCTNSPNFKTGVERIRLKRIPDYNWETLETFHPVLTITACSAIAAKRNNEIYYSSYDATNKVCELGKAFVDDNVEGISGGRIVAIAPVANLTKVGIYLHQDDSNVVLPNGRVCPSADNGIPPLPEQRFRFGLAEAEGNLYVMGGAMVSDNSKTDTCLKLDLKNANSDWQSCRELPGVGHLAKGGAISYQESDGSYSIFAIYKDMCPNSGPSGGHVIRYQPNLDQWSTMGLWQSRKFIENPVVNGNLIYVVGGKGCLSGASINEILTYDMSRPFDEPDLKVGLLENTGLIASGCTLYKNQGKTGIMCAGGENDGGNFLGRVEFVELKDGLPHTNSYRITNLANARAYAYLFSFDNGQIVLNGGHADGGVTKPPILKWDRCEEGFNTEGDQSTKNTKWAGYGYVTAKYVMGNCWKYL